MLTTINAGDTAWMLLCAALVFLMVPGLAFFYAGLSSKKNPLSIVMPCLLGISLVSLQWVLFGYSLSFGPDHNGWIGTLAWAGLRGVGQDPNLEYAGTIPQQAFMIYHGMLAMVTPVIFLSAFADRIKRLSLCVFVLLWTTLVYDPVAHWIWGVGGFLRYAGVLDFSGGTVIQLNAGVTALAMTLVMKKSADSSESDSPFSQLPLAILGSAIVWFGWFGLNAGTALSAGALATNAFVVTQISAVTAGLTWSLLDRLLHQKLTPLGLVTGAIVGMAAISPAAGYVSVWGAIGIGLGAAIFSYMAIVFMLKTFGPGDSFYTIGIFGVGGLWGTFATGLWATKIVNSNGENGLFYGSPVQLMLQLKATLAILIYSFGMSWLLLKLVDVVLGLTELCD